MSGKKSKKLIPTGYDGMDPFDILSNENNDYVRGFTLDTNPQTGMYGDYPDEAFGYQDYQGEDEDDEEYNIERESNDKAPEMPSEFYDQVENFLKRPPPSIGNIDGGKKSKKGSQEIKGSKSAKELMFPPIHKKSPIQEDIKDIKELDDIISNTKESKKKKKIRNIPNESKLYVANPLMNQNGSDKPTINSQLLKEAFAYTDQLLRDAVLEEQYEKEKLSKQSSYKEVYQEDINNNHMDAYRKLQSKSAPTDHHLSQGNSGGSSKRNQNPVNMVRSLKSKSNKASKGSNSSTKQTNDREFSIKQDAEQDSKRNPVNFDELITNFQNGLNIDKLRKELDQSRKALAQSEDFIRQQMFQFR